jgi:DUF4097 and DUF4098 domain-containing protein YvlB
LEASGVKKDISATNENGGITIRDAGGAVTAKTKFGATVLERVSGLVTAASDNGAITITRALAGVTASTKFAPVKLDQVAGAVEVMNDNGEIVVAGLRRIGKGCEPVKLSTRFNGIRVELPADGDYDLAAKTMHGRITSDVTVLMQGQLREEQWSGRIGRGGCELRLVNDNGGITIHGGEK